MLAVFGLHIYSRIGLYGFILGEIEIPQRMIPEGVRGVVNGVATSLTGLSTVLLFALGSYVLSQRVFRCLLLFRYRLSSAALSCILIGRLNRIPRSSLNEENSTHRSSVFFLRLFLRSATESYLRGP